LGIHQVILLNANTVTKPQPTLFTLGVGYERRVR
jgi:hypothetical protein